MLRPISIAATALALSCAARPATAPTLRAASAERGLLDASADEPESLIVPLRDASSSEAQASVHASPQWRCSTEELALPSAGPELDVPSASIFSDAIVGASLMVRERPRRAQERAPQFDAEVHFRSPRGSTVARVVVTGPPMPGVPWRIDESNAGVLRRCAADGVCQLFVVDPSSRRVEPRQGADDDRAVFALRTTLESSATPVTVLAVQRRAGATAVVIGATPQGLESPSLGGSLQGVFFENDELGFWLRDRDGRLHAVGGSTPTSLAPCTSGRARPFGVISQSVTLGAFGEPFELRAELARNGADRTCVTRLYGRASIRLVASSIDVTTTGQGALEGLLRTPRAVRAVRCVATGA